MSTTNSKLWYLQKRVGQNFHKSHDAHEILRFSDRQTYFCYHNDGKMKIVAPVGGGQQNSAPFESLT